MNSSTISSYFHRYERAISSIQKVFVPIFLLFLRLWVAWVFFKSGLTKVSSWDSTLYLFELEYQVPIISWELAAYLGTAAELILPIFIAFGLLTRPTALALFLFNIVAVVSYPVLWEKGFYDHQLWGLMILNIIVWGAGYISLDNIIQRKLITK
ncbi:DoxX family protein [Vibrio hannami]|uniref:DoxX family protein n=1 Tax=Vibrio hannami TaxID=2717094 RepID=UPI00240F6319|nr:DoxX family protein [Vibrio hannami]MDG3086709.1 DoxX family protein [Vibrio hannami]